MEHKNYDKFTLWLSYCKYIFDKHIETDPM